MGLKSLQKAFFLLWIFPRSFLASHVICKISHFKALQVPLSLQKWGARMGPSLEEAGTHQDSPALSFSGVSVQGFLGSSAGKESACNAGDLGSVPWLGRSPAGRHGNPLQYFCLENLHGQRSLVGYRSWGCKESYTTERLSTAQHFFCKRKINSNSGCQNGVSRSAASASRDKLLGINFLRLHPRSTD